MWKNLQMLKPLPTLLMAALAFIVPASEAAATVHYISSSGADSNDGLSTSSPWGHVPGMATCSLNCASYRPAAGDRFILRGGDTWTTNNFPILWAWSGVSGNSIYLGVDHAWFTSAQWSRPVFDAKGATIPGTWNMFMHFVYSGVQYVTVDDLEMKGLYWSGPQAYGHLAYITTNSASHIVLTNLYMHAWYHSTNVGTADSLLVVLGDTNSPFAAGSVCNGCVVDGSDGTGAGDSGAAFYSFPTVTRSVIHDIPNAILACSGGELGNDHIYNIKLSFDPTIHANAIETLGSGSGIMYIHDNVIHDMSIGEVMMIGNTNETDYVWNNVIYNLPGGNAIHFPQTTGQSPNAASFWNNTIVPRPGQPCFIQVAGWAPPATITIQNNHCIDTTTLHSAITSSTLIDTFNILQTPSQAGTQAYSSLQSFAYSPLSRTNATVGAGINLSVKCSGLLTTLCKDTTYACTTDSTNHVICTAKSSVARPQNGPWDAGAYQYLPGSLLPPTGLSVIVH